MHKLHAFYYRVWDYLRQQNVIHGRPFQALRTEIPCAVLGIRSKVSAYIRVYALLMFSPLCYPLAWLRFVATTIERIPATSQRNFTSAFLWYDLLSQEVFWVIRCNMYGDLTHILLLIENANMVNKFPTRFWSWVLSDSNWEIKSVVNLWTCPNFVPRPLENVPCQSPHTRAALKLLRCIVHQHSWAFYYQADG